jgi:hypothetical protein
MNRTTALTAVALCTAVLVTPAHAAQKPPSKKKPVCFQVTDPTGDGNPNAAGFAPVGPSHDSLDILSGDVATGAQAMVLAIRLKSLAKDTVLAGGSTYRFAWVAGSVKQDVALYVDYDGAQHAAFRPDAAGAGTETLDVSGVTDTSTNTITFTIPRRVNPALKPGTALTGLQINSGFGLNREGSQMSTGADVASSAAKYTDGAPTCLKGA